MRTAIFAGLCFIAYAINEQVMMEYDKLVFYIFFAMVLADAFMTGIKIAKK